MIGERVILSTEVETRMGCLRLMSNVLYLNATCIISRWEELIVETFMVRSHLDVS
jgi:hypothetical protein